MLHHEGGFNEDDRDPGGATNFGVTQKTLARFRGSEVTSDDVRNLTIEDARDLYRHLFWNVVRADDMIPGIDLALFDFAVHAGPQRAVRTLQRVLDIKDDGIVGLETLRAVRADAPQRVIRDLSRQRLAFLESLETWPVFGRGWRRRVRAVERAASLRVGATKFLQHKDTDIMTNTKDILSSRTVWANTVGLLAVAAGLLGLDVSSLDANALSEALVQVIAAGSFIASTFFRIIATRQILK